VLRALILVLLLGAPPAWAGLPEDAAPLVPAGAVAPDVARGAVVWLHGSYDAASEARPADPDWLRPLLARGYELWHFDRPVRPDPLAEGGARLVQGVAALRAGGYRRVVVAGFSRGAFIGLAALARPALVDAVAAVSPAAHGLRVERRGEALAAFGALMDAGREVGLALVLLRDDRWDPMPEARAALARASVPGRAGLLLLLDRPEGLEGHMGSFEPEFAVRFAECLAAFLDGAAPASACAGR
jgi:pimeloyl-ACP methyl ester carboxylesterase